MRKSTLLRSCICIAFFLSSASAFSVTFGPGTPTQCDDFTISWTGGQAPFEILLTPAFHPLVNISVPSSAFNNGEGSYSISQLPLPEGIQFLLTMSDGTGFGTGGTTTLLTVGAPIANNSCDTKGSQDFYFQLPAALKQCAVYNFTGYDLADQPVTITGLVPGGESVVLHPPNGTNYSWIADVQEGTNLLFFMTDSQGRQGGVSDVETVAASTDGSCLVAGSVSSTVSAPSQPTSNQNILPVSNTPNAGVIAGATVGSVVFLGLLITLGICWRRKALRSSNVTDKVDSYEVKRDYQPNFQYKNQADHQPSHLANVFTSDPFSQHLRQMSYADSSVGSSSVASPNRMASMGQTSPDTFVSQTSSIPPAAQLYAANVSAGGVAVNDPYVPFNQIQPSRQASDLVAEYGDVGNSSTVSPTNRRMAAMAVQSVSPNYAFPYQTTPVSHVAPPETLPYHTSAGRSTVNGPPSPTNQAQPLSLSSNMERFARRVDGGSPPPGGRVAASVAKTATDDSTEYIVHTDVEDVQVARDNKKVVELPPQYAHRQLPNSQPTLTPSSES